MLKSTVAGVRRRVGCGDGLVCNNMGNRTRDRCCNTNHAGTGSRICGGRVLKEKCYHSDSSRLGLGMAIFGLETCEDICHTCPCIGLCLMCSHCTM